MTQIASLIGAESFDLESTIDGRKKTRTAMNAEETKTAMAG
jgi:hypothetical protein